MPDTRTRAIIHWFGNLRVRDIVMFLVVNSAKIGTVVAITTTAFYYTEDATAGKYLRYKMEQWKVVTEDSSVLTNFLPRSITEKLVLKAEMGNVEQSMEKQLAIQGQLQSDIAKLNGSGIVLDLQLRQLIQDNAELKKQVEQNNIEMNRDIKSILRGIAKIQAEP